MADPKNMLEAITAAVTDPVAGAAAGSSIPLVEDKPNVETPVVDAAAAETAGAEAGAVAPVESGEAAAGEPAADGDESGDDGESGDEAGADAEAGESEAEKAAEAAKAVAAGAKKEPDAVNDPIPAHLHAGTQKRMTKLIDMVKAASEKTKELEENNAFIVEKIVDTGASTEQYAQTLGILKAINSGDPAAREQAANALFAEAMAIFKLLGKSAPGVDPLDEHEDLVKEVRAGLVPVERAREIALARGRQQVQEQQRTVQSEAQKVRDSVTKGISDLNAWGAARAAADPDYAAGKGQLVMAALKPVFQTLPPDQWVGVFERSYAATPFNRAKPVVPPVVSGAAPQPLRAKQPAGNTATAPKNVMEAIMAGVAAAG